MVTTETQIEINYQAKKWKNNSEFFISNNKPVFEEKYVKDLNIIGELPKWLNGVYMRNGPNPHFPSEDLAFPYDGDGMVHALYFEKGGVSYRNKWVETKELEAEKKAGQAIWNGLTKPSFPSSKIRKKYNAPFTPVKNTANTSIVHHGEHILALYEGGKPYKITKDLDTIGEFDYNGQIKGMIAHPKIDLVTGDMHFLQTGMVQYPFMRYYVVNKNGQVIKNVPIYTKGTVVVHDMILTPNYVVFFWCPMKLSLIKTFASKNPLEWKPERGTKIAVLPRNGRSKDISWTTMDPFFVWHTMNGFEQNGNIVLDYVKHNYNHDGSTIGVPHLQRTVIHPKKGIVSDNILNDSFIEFPNINHRFRGQKYRFGYATKVNNNNDSAFAHFTELVQYDFEKNVYKIHRLPKGYTIGEPTFVPHPHKSDEAEGVIVAFAYDKNTETSKLIIIEPLNFDKAPMAVVNLPFRVPNGFHGDWIGF
ncbi:MAG: carotenoid oxygenase family protein [Saprospiraceae bacterium]